MLRAKQAIFAFAAFFGAYAFYVLLIHQGPGFPGIPRPQSWRPSSGAAAPQGPKEKHLVVASMKKENTTWIAREMRDWDASVYVVDDPGAALTVPKNKGREGMVYLTYIIDHYDALPEVVAFVHAGRFQWHNDDPKKDSAAVLQRLQIPYLRKNGYANLRCHWAVGCPAPLRIKNPDLSRPLHVHYPDAFRVLFPGRVAKDDWPEKIGVSCCAQFAVTRQTILKNKKEDYERWRKWLLKTEIKDDISGRILEYSWHMLFGQPDNFCPEAKKCYCDVFGLCDLKDCTPGECKGRYEFPKKKAAPSTSKPSMAKGTETPKQR